MDYKARFYSPALNRFIQPDSIVPDPTNPQAWNRYSYVYNSPINYADPTGHVPCQSIYCSPIWQTGSGGNSGSSGNNGGSNSNDECDLDCEFENFDAPDRVEQDDMVPIGAPLPGMYDELSPAEYQLLLRENKLGPYKFNPALDAQLAFKMWMIQQQAFNAASEVGGNQLNSPADAFRHAYWNALLVREFGAEFTESFTTAHETGWTPSDDADQMSFMDLHNNQVGIDIAVANPTMTDQQIQEAVLDALTLGDLIVWDGIDFYYSNQCPSC